MNETTGDEDEKVLKLLFSELENNLSDDSGIEGWEYDKNIDQEQLPFDDEISNETNEDVIRLKTEQRKIRDRIDSIQLLYESIKERSFYPRLQKLDLLESEIKESDSHQVLINQEKIRKEYEALLLFYKKKKLTEVKRIQDKFFVNENFLKIEYQESLLEAKNLKIKNLYSKKFKYLKKMDRFKYNRNRWALQNEFKESKSINGKAKDNSITGVYPEEEGDLQTRSFNGHS